MGEYSNALVAVSGTFSAKHFTSSSFLQEAYIAAVDYQQLADNTVEKSCVFDTRD